MSALKEVTCAEPFESFVLPISKGYVNHWGIQEAIRELIQNAIDGVGKFSFDILDSSLIITSEGVKLSPSDLILGNSTKRDEVGSIGKFGEGFKLAMAVLAREDREIIVYNGNVTWIPVYKYSETFGDQVLHIDEYYMQSHKDSEDLSFVIRNMTKEELELVVNNCLQMREAGETIDVSKGQILLDEPGKLYVNGLYVTDTKLKYGYNIKPEFLKIERDRQTVSDFDLQWITGNMWGQVKGRNESIALDIANAVPDVSYLSDTTPSYSVSDIADSCAELFTKSFGDSVPVSTQQEANELTELGKKAAVVPSNYVRIIKQSSSYVHVSMPKPRTPADELKDFLKANKKYMRRQAIVSMKQLIDSAVNWRQ